VPREKTDVGMWKNAWIAGLFRVDIAARTPAGCGAPQSRTARRSSAGGIRRRSCKPVSVSHITETNFRPLMALARLYHGVPLRRNALRLRVLHSVFLLPLVPVRPWRTLWIPLHSFVETLRKTRVNAV
jgi:hypothetical protein